MLVVFDRRSNHEPSWARPLLKPLVVRASIPIVLLAAACTPPTDFAKPGDRARNNACPDFEVCSSRAPRGLKFRGAIYSDFEGRSAIDIAFNGLDDSPKPTAVGGLQTIRFEVVAPDPYVPTSTAPVGARFEGEALTVERIADEAVVVRALAEGAAVLRIEDEDGALIDRVELTAKPVAAVELGIVKPVEHALVPPTIVAGGPCPLHVQLTDAKGGRLVDENVWSDTATTSGYVWDQVLAERDMPGEHRLAVFAGAQRFEHSLRVVDTVDRLDRPLVGSGGGIVASDRSEGDYVGEPCFQATKSGEIVSVPSWRARVTSERNFRIAPIGDVVAGPFACFELRSASKGVRSFEVEAGGRVRSFDVRFADRE